MSAQLQSHLSLRADIRLRPMHLDDLDAIMQIEPTIYTHPWTRGNFSDSLNSGYSAWVLEVQVLEDKSELIGYALMMMVMDEAHLLNLSIAKIRQKQGLGRYLLEHMLKISKTHQAANMFLEVRPSNISAIALYESMGFSEMAVRRGYYPADSTISKTGREDAVLMGLAL